MFKSVGVFFNVFSDLVQNLEWRHYFFTQGGVFSSHNSGVLEFVFVANVVNLDEQGDVYMYFYLRASPRETAVQEKPDCSVREKKKISIIEQRLVY